MDSNSYAKYAKRIIIGLVVVTISLALITTNNVATMWAVISSRNGSAAVSSGDGAAPAQNSGTQQSSNNTGSSNSVTPSGGTSTGLIGGDSSSPSSGTAGTDNSTPAGPADNSGAGTTTNTDGGSRETPADGNQGTPADGNKDNGGKTEEPSGEMTKEQIVDLYIKSLNNAKSKAGKVVLVKDGALNYNEIFEAGMFSSFSGMLKAFFKLDDVNSESSKDELPPRNVTCNLNVANVESATCKEENGIYTVEILLKDSTNPVQGDGGVGSVVNIISEDQITGGVKNIPGISLSNIKLDYTQVKITATIEKATGNLTYLIADAPSVLSLDAKAGLLKINGARVGIETVSEFSVAY